MVGPFNAKPHRRLNAEQDWIHWARYTAKQTNGPGGSGASSRGVTPAASTHDVSATVYMQGFTCNVSCEVAPRNTAAAPTSSIVARRFMGAFSAASFNI